MRTQAASHTLTEDSKLKTAEELRDMIATRLGVGGVFIAVNSDPIYGWHATIMTAPAQVIRAQQRIEEIAAELRGEGYQLRPRI